MTRYRLDTVFNRTPDGVADPAFRFRHCKRDRRPSSPRRCAEPSLFEPKSPLPGNGIFRPETNGPKRRRSSRGQFLALAEKQGATGPRMIGHRLMGSSLMFTVDIYG